MLNSFYQYVQRINEAGPPPPAPTGGASAPPPPGGDPTGGTPPPGGDPMGGMGMGGGGGMGGDPMGGGGAGGGSAPRAAIKVTTVWDALRNVLGKEAEKQEGNKKHQPIASKKESPKPKSLIQ